MIAVIAAVGVVAPAAAAEVRVDAAEPSAALLVDGKPAFGEWPHDDLRAPGIRVAFSRDESRLNVLLDALALRTPGDRVSATLLVDVDRDGDADQRYRLGIDGTVKRQAVGDVLPPPPNPDLPPPPEERLPTSSSGAISYGCFSADGTRTLTFATIGCDRHYVAEFSVALAEIGAEFDESVNLVVAMDGGAGSVKFPASGGLAEPIVVGPLQKKPALFGEAEIELKPSGVEVHQVTAGSTTTPLVAGKPTVVRVLPRVTNAFHKGHKAVVELRASIPGGEELPGSPLTKSMYLPFESDRLLDHHGATFTLPDAWTQEHFLVLTARATQHVGPPSDVVTTNVIFLPTTKTSVWSVPVVAGGLAPQDDTMTEQEFRAKTLLPVADMYFPRRPPVEFTGGAPVAGDARDIAKAVYAGAKAAWAATKQMTGKVPYLLPRQVYGHLHVSHNVGATSDPVWGGGLGRAAGGSWGTSFEFTMAHEMTHNLDRKASPTWGAHVDGCESGAVDPAWPHPGDNTIHDIGYDVPNFLPVAESELDLMTVCGHDQFHEPAKWIGAYHWNALLNVFRPGAAGAKSARAAVEDQPDPPVAPDVLQITGSIERSSGAVTLDPIFRGPNVVDVPAGGEYVIELLDGSGERLASHPFGVSFVDAEGEERPRASFAADVPGPAGLREVRIVGGGRVLARRVLSATAPRVRVVSPNGGERLPARPFDLVVDARDGDGDALAWRATASGDGGRTWLPVPGAASTGRLRVDPANLPGGSESLLRVEATDGLRTVTDTSDAPFSLPVTPPQPSILQPGEGAHLPTDRVIVLRGSAVTSSLEEIPGENLLWFDDERLIGEGGEARVQLKPGTHRLRLVAVDAAGRAVGADAVKIVVVGTCPEKTRASGRGPQCGIAVPGSRARSARPPRSRSARAAPARP